MALYFATGSPTTELSRGALREALDSALAQLGPRERVLAVPPDFTRLPSHAGVLTCMAYDYYGERLIDMMPALGTHHAMSKRQLDVMYPGLPHSLVRVHRWRDDVITLGEVPAEYVREVTEGTYQRPWPVQMNRLVAAGGHDLILSFGQVVPHEVIGMAGHMKNLFVGTGGVLGINESHYLSAVYGIERTLGRADHPLRKILHRAAEEFCRDLPIVHVLTVVGTRQGGEAPGGEPSPEGGEVQEEDPYAFDKGLVVRGLFIGDDAECFERAAELAREVNFTFVDAPVERIVAWLDPEEFESTWLGNKAIYRTRLAIADGGELIVLAPGVERFGEDGEIDRLIRKYGYRTTPAVRQMVAENAELQGNLSAAAHLMQGSSEDRFRVTYCPGGLSREEIQGVGYEYGELSETMDRYSPDRMADGWNDMPGGERIFFVRRPALGLWAYRPRLEGGAAG